MGKDIPNTYFAEASYIISAIYYTTLAILPEIVYTIKVSYKVISFLVYAIGHTPIFLLIPVIPRHSHFIGTYQEVEVAWNVTSIEWQQNTFDAVIYINRYRILMVLVPC